MIIYTSCHSLLGYTSSNSQINRIRDTKEYKLKVNEQTTNEHKVTSREVSTNSFQVIQTMSGNDLAVEELIKGGTRRG